MPRPRSSALHISLLRILSIQGIVYAIPRPQNLSGGILSEVRIYNTPSLEFCLADSPTPEPLQSEDLYTQYSATEMS